MARPRAALPSLVVVVVVDQLRADYLDRWAADWRGGFRRLREQGVFYVAGMQDHAITSTAPGHATVLSGRFPAHTRIWSNEFGVVDTAAPLIGARGPGASPRRFQGTTLADWMTAAHPATRFLSVSFKDRSAILPIGRRFAPVFWFADHRFTTSRYYADTLPAWVTAFDRSLPPGLSGSPVDSVTLELAMTGAAELGLGRRPDRTDLLVVGLSETDAIGHQVGPDAPELHHHLVSLDRWLGRFLDRLSDVTGGRLLVVLTADHGVTPVPEERQRQGLPAGRLSLRPMLAAVNAELEAAGHGPHLLEEVDGLVFPDSARWAETRLDRDSLAEVLARRIRPLPGIARVYTPGSLARLEPGDTIGNRWRHTIPAGFPWLVGVAPEPGYIWSGSTRGTSHGTPNADDVLVPVVFLGRELSPRRVTRPVRSVDVAPTLALLLELKPVERLDGSALPEVRSTRPRGR